MTLIPTIVRSVFAYFKTDPKAARDVVIKALGWLVIAGAVIDKAIEVLKQVLIGLN